MGVNILNTIAESMSKYLATNDFIKLKPILRILSNLAVYRRTTSEFMINILKLDYKEIEGQSLVEVLIKSNKIAMEVLFRASTHNKGIMNGVDAVVLALGQDVRALESSIHTYLHTYVQ